MLSCVDTSSVSGSGAAVLPIATNDKCCNIPVPVLYWALTWTLFCLISDSQLGCNGKIFYIYLKCESLKPASEVIAEIEPIRHCVDMIKVGSQAN